MKRHAPCRDLPSLLFRPSSPRAALAILCVAALFSACGSHDTPSADIATSSAPVAAATNSSASLNTSASLLPLPNTATSDRGGLAAAIVPASDLSAGLNRTLATLDATAHGNAADPAQSALASLAADSRQVKPVIHYAPGDGPADDGGATQSTN